MTPPNSTSPVPSSTLGGFRGDHAFLSNFHPCAVTYLGRTYRCSEAAYMAQKCALPGDRDRFLDLDGPAAKRLGAELQLRPGWEWVRIAHMRGALAAKFTQNADLRERLLATGTLQLVEHNTWGDTFWGVCEGVGLNWLGRFLMDLRTLLARDLLPAMPAQPMDRIADRESFLGLAHGLLAHAHHASATELWLLQRIVAAALRNPDFDLSREQAELQLLVERLLHRSHPMDTSPIVLAIEADASARTWKARAHRTGPDGCLLDEREASGSLELVQVLRRDKEGREKLEDAPITEAELLGIALEVAMELGSDWGETFLLEADTHQNGMLKVSLHDWVRAGRLNEGDSGFVYARQAWSRVLAALRQEPPRLWVRWKA